MNTEFWDMIHGYEVINWTHKMFEYSIHTSILYVPAFLYLSFADDQSVNIEQGQCHCIQCILASNPTILCESELDYTQHTNTIQLTPFNTSLNQKKCFTQIYRMILYFSSLQWLSISLVGFSHWKLLWSFWISPCAWRFLMYGINLWQTLGEAWQHDIARTKIQFSDRLW